MSSGRGFRGMFRFWFFFWVFVFRTRRSCYCCRGALRTYLSVIVKADMGSLGNESDVPVPGKCFGGSGYVELIGEREYDFSILDFS